jgi:hypothetical protein
MDSRSSLNAALLPSNYYLEANKKFPWNLNSSAFETKESFS